MEKDYRRAVNLIAAVMIMQFCLWYAASFIYSWVSQAVFSEYGALKRETLEELLLAFLYALAFGIPIISARLFGRGTPSVILLKRPSKYTVPIVLVSVCAVYAAAMLNTLVTTPFDAFGFDIYTIDTSMTVAPATFFAKLLSLVIVPAIVEELLFRGVILGSLLPYGKTQAIVASALLFAVMHQNPKQFIYAFAAGCVIGYFVTEQRSIFVGIIIHAVNNLISLVNMTVFNACTEEVYTAYSASLYTIVFLGAAAALPLLISLARSEKEEENAEKVPHKAKHFFLSLMAVYFVLSVGNFVFTLIVSRLSL